MTGRPVRLCVATDSPDPSGLGVHLLGVAAGAVKAGYDVTVSARPGTSLVRDAAASGLKVWPYEDRLVEPWVVSRRFDIVHVHAGIGWEGHRLTAAARASGAAVVRTEHLPYLLTDEGQQREYAEHGSDVDLVVAVSESVAASYRPHAMAPVAVVDNGVPEPKAPEPGAATRLRGRLGLRPEQPFLLHVGRFTPQKRHDVLLRALARLVRTPQYADTQLALVGTGPLAGPTARLVAELGLAGNVRLLGSRPDVPVLMAAADLLVLPSAFEGMPLVLLEAMAAGLPAVVSDAPGTRDVAGPDLAWVAAVDDSDALADALAEAIASPDERAVRATAGRRRYEERHTLRHMQNATVARYGDLPIPQTKPQEEQPMGSTRVVFVGAGGIAHRHAGVLETMPDVVVTGVADPDLERATELANRLGATPYADPAEMLDAVEADAMWICVPPFAHGEPERLAIDRRLPFFVEKPVALDLELAEEIAKGSEGLVTGVGYHWRYLDVLDDVRRAFDGRPPRLATGVWYGATPPPRWWWSETGSGGQMVEQATHLVDLVRYLMGDVTSVYGVAERTEREAYESLDVATSSTATLQTASGGIATVVATCLLEWQHRAELHLFGQGVAVELTDHDVMVDTGHGRPVTPNPTDPVWREDRDFLDAVRGGENRVRCPYPEAVATLRTTLAIAESARTGAPVRLDAEGHR